MICLRNMRLLIKKFTFFYFNRVAANKKFTMLVSSTWIVHLYANIVWKFQVSSIYIFLIIKLLI